MNALASPAARAGLQTCHDPAADRFLRDIEAGHDWFDALLDAVAAWRTAHERHDGRDYHYLVGDEAFDWLLLAERLLGDVNGLVPAAQRDELLFNGRAPRPMTPTDFRRRMGPGKLRGLANYWYGVLVEEALQLVVEHEVRKSRRGTLRPEESLLDDIVYERIYGKTRRDLLIEYWTERGEAPPDAVSLADLRAFTYWLFKYRLKHGEPARIASDTKKGIAWLRRMRQGALDACA